GYGGRQASKVLRRDRSDLAERASEGVGDVRPGGEREYSHLHGGRTQSGAHATDELVADLLREVLERACDLLIAQTCALQHPPLRVTEARSNILGDRDDPRLQPPLEGVSHPGTGCVRIEYEPLGTLALLAQDVAEFDRVGGTKAQEHAGVQARGDGPAHFPRPGVPLRDLLLLEGREVKEAR